MRVTRSIFEQLGGVASEIACLERGVSDGRAARQTFDHGEQQIRVSVTLRGVQHIVHIRHGSGHTHGTDVWRSFVCPEGELHV